MRCPKFVTYIYFEGKNFGGSGIIFNYTALRSKSIGLAGRYFRGLKYKTL